MTKRNFEMTTEQMEQILDGAPDEEEFWNTSLNMYYRINSGLVEVLEPTDWFIPEWHISGFHERDVSSAPFIKLSDIRAELDSRQSVQAYFNSDERGSIEQEQSVIERFTNLAASFREIGGQFQTTNSIERDTWFAAAEYIERELKEVAGDD